MCGIAGLWRRNGVDSADNARIEKMAKTLLHRGPDDFGYLLSESRRGLAVTGQTTESDIVPDVLLASRRLSIIDLSIEGRQPIANETKNVFVVFNGAIHNYVELREELEALGHNFHSKTDTEVIVHAYEQWGESCASRFNGMWAYVIWDLRENRLICSRDRFGIKPFFVAWKGETFYFASEVKAILAAGEIAAAPNLDWIHRYLTLDECENGQDTAFEGITQLAAGHNLVITRDSCEEIPYWDYTHQSEAYDYERPAETFRELFRDAVNLRLRSDVPVALLLSGGLDSSSIAVHASVSEQQARMEAYTAIFPGSKFDETQYAEIISKHTGMKWHRVEYEPSGLLEDLEAVNGNLDAPARRGQELVRFHLLKAVSGQARVVLEGQGADEMLAGYPNRYAGPYFRSELRALRPWNVHRRLPRILRAWRVMNYSRSTTAPRPSILGSLLREKTLTDSSENRTPEQFQDPLTRILFKDHALGLLPELLHFGDAISMGHSLESRLPFLDHRLVEFIFGLPFDQKMRGSETKYVLRRAFRKDLPESILNRRNKIGFETPMSQWLIPHKSVLSDLLNSEGARKREILNPEGVRHCLSHFETDGRAATRLFRSAALELWFRRYIN